MRASVAIVGQGVNYLSYYERSAKLFATPTMEDGMAIEARLEGLANRHRELEKQIMAELAHPSSDDLRIASLKREKLRIKDQMERVRMSLSTAA